MNRAQAAMLLGVASSYDGREVTEEDATAWAAALPEVAFEDARDAVVAHYRESRFRVMPADVLTRVRRIRRERLAGIAPPVPPAELADRPALEAVWVRRVRELIAGGASPEQAAAEVSRAHGIEPRVEVEGNPARARALIQQATRALKGGSNG